MPITSIDSRSLRARAADLSRAPVSHQIHRSWSVRRRRNPPRDLLPGCAFERTRCTLRIHQSTCSQNLPCPLGNDARSSLSLAGQPPLFAPSPCHGGGRHSIKRLARETAISRTTSVGYGEVKLGWLKATP